MPFVGGTTYQGFYVSMNNEVVQGIGDLGNYTDLVAHEIGHLFGLDDKDGDKDGKDDKYYVGNKGIMKYRGLQLNTISDDDVNMILKFAKDALSGKTLQTDAKVTIIAQKGESNGTNPIGVKNENTQSTDIPEN